MDALFYLKIIRKSTKGYNLKDKHLEYFSYFQFLEFLFSRLFSMNLGMFILFKPVKLKVNQPSNEEKKRLK